MWGRPAPDDGSNMDTTLDDLITKVRDALENAGLHTWEIAEGIVNVHTQPVLDDSQAKATRPTWAR